MTTTQKKRPPKKTTKNEMFEDAPQKVRTGDGGDKDDTISEEEESLKPVFSNQYAISCGADEYIMPSTANMTVAELRSYIQANRPNGMSIDPAMPCFVNGNYIEDEASLKLQGNLRVEFTKKAGVKGRGV